MNNNNLDNPLVSFVVRTKNEEKYIGKVLKLLFAQTYKNIEVIIVDSGSTDKTLEMIGNFPVKLIKIKPEDFNFSYALNIGIEKSNGEFIGIISGHSIPISDKWLEGGLKHFKNGSVAGVTGPYSENPIGYYNRKLGRLEFTFNGKPEHHYKYLTNTNALIRKNMWKKYRFDESLKEGCEDYDWACEMLYRGYDIIKEPKFGVFHSHYLIGRLGYLGNIRKWNKITKKIDEKIKKGTEK